MSIYLVADAYHLLWMGALVANENRATSKSSHLANDIRIQALQDTQRKTDISGPMQQQIIWHINTALSGLQDSIVYFA